MSNEGVPRHTPHERTRLNTHYDAASRLRKHHVIASGDEAAGLPVCCGECFVAENVQQHMKRVLVPRISVATGGR